MEFKTTQQTPQENPSSSLDLLAQFIGKKVTAMIRYSWWKKEDISKYTHMSREQSFSHTAGPLAVTFDDGSTLGVSSDQEANSVIVWLDQRAGRADTTLPLSKNPRLSPIKTDDESYAEHFWSKFVGQTLTRFSILKSTEMNPCQAGLPSELGLCFYFGNNKRFIASHSLNIGDDDFSVLVDSQIPPSISSKLEELPLM